MIILIDNYDSFSYNLYQLIGSIEPEIKVVRNDEFTPEQLEAMSPESIVLSPDLVGRRMPEFVLIPSKSLEAGFQFSEFVSDIKQFAPLLVRLCRMLKNLCTASHL